MSDNPQIRDLLHHHSDDLSAKFLEAGVVEFTFPVATPMESGPMDAMRSTLRLVARGLLVMPVWFGRETVRRLLKLAQREAGSD